MGIFLWMRCPCRNPNRLPYRCTASDPSSFFVSRWFAFSLRLFSTGPVYVALAIGVWSHNVDKTKPCEACVSPLLPLSRSSATVLSARCCFSVSYYRVWQFPEVASANDINLEASATYAVPDLLMLLSPLTSGLIVSMRRKRVRQR